jgi:hypothetical protein
MVYPALLSLMRTPRLPVADWTDAPADLNVLVRFAERRNLVSARVPSHFKRSLRTAKLFLQPRLLPHRGRSLIPYLSHRPWWIIVIYQSLSSLIVIYYCRLLWTEVWLTHSRTPNVYMCADVVVWSVADGCLILHFLYLLSGFST